MTFKKLEGRVTYAKPQLFKGLGQTVKEKINKSQSCRYISEIDYI